MKRKDLLEYLYEELRSYVERNEMSDANWILRIIRDLESNL